MASSASLVSIDNYFPDVILAKIFRFCPPSSRKVLGLVSKRWNKVVDRFLGRILIIKTSTGYAIDHESCLDRMSIKANFWITLSEHKRKEEAETESDGKQLDAGDASRVPALPPIQDPEHVKKIGFAGPVDANSFNSYLNQCINITGLCIHFSVFLGLDDKKSLQVASTLNNLRDLVIDSSGMNSDSCSYTEMFEHKKGFKSLIKFLDNSEFPNLTKFICALPYLESLEGRMAKCISFFLGKHAKTMKHFSFQQKYDVSENGSDDEDGNGEGEKEESEGDGGEDNNNKTKNSKARSNSSYLSLKQLATNAIELKKLSLAEIHVILRHKQESAPLWKNMLLHQNAIQKCIFAGDKMPCPVCTIEENGATLVTLRLDIREGVDFKCFKNCVHLKYLTLGGRKDTFDSDREMIEEEEGDDDDEFPLQVKNSTCLPESLESIELINLRTHRDDARHISTGLPNLRELVMNNLGWEGNLGLRLADLANIWKMRKLDHFYIKYSLNASSYWELGECTDVTPELNLLTCMVQSNSFFAATRFEMDVWKNESGLYSTLKSELDECLVDCADADIFQIPNLVKLNENEEEEETDSDEDDETDDEEEHSGEEEEESEDEESGSESDESEKSKE